MTQLSKDNILIMILCLITIMQVTFGTMIITQPSNTSFPDNKVDYLYANFGKVPYGKTLSYPLVYMNNSLCEVGQLIHFNYSTYVITDDQGYCSFTTKARVAQALGAQGIIIGSDAVLYSHNVVYADDYNGRKVHIPTLFVKRHDYLALIQLQNPQIKVNFDVVKSLKSKVLFYLSAAGREAYVFLRDFSQYYLRIRNKIDFEVVYSTTECQWCRQSECLMGYKYCAFDVDNWQVGIGSYIIQEQLRQYGIFKKFGVMIYMHYMNQFDKLCDYDWRNSAYCSKQILKSLKLQQNIKFNNAQQTMLQWRTTQSKSGFVGYPEISVNGMIFSGSLKAKGVFTMICESLTNPGGECQQGGNQQQGTNYTWLIILLVLLFIGILGVGFYLYRRFVNKQITNDMSSKVNQLVAKYATKVNEQNKKRRQRVMQKLNQEI